MDLLQFDLKEHVAHLNFAFIFNCVRAFVEI
jgi:hypothetical protein